jgi:hypothetical protein
MARTTAAVYCCENHGGSRLNPDISCSTRTQQPRGLGRNCVYAPATAELDRLDRCVGPIDIVFMRSSVSANCGSVVSDQFALIPRPVLSPNLEEQLRERYPLIFADRIIKSYPDPVPFWGFGCGDGWFDLIDTLCHNLQRATKSGSPQVVAEQVKEKFGGLCFYVDSRDERQDGMIEMAESMSFLICDVCGDRGKKGGSGWIRVRCPKHVETNGSAV